MWTFHAWRKAYKEVLFNPTVLTVNYKLMFLGAFWSAFWPCPLGNGTDFSDNKYSDSKLV